MTDTAIRNASIVRDYHERVWVHDDLTALETWDAEAAVDVAGFADATVEAIREDVLRYRGAFTDVHAEILDLVAQDDKVVLHWETSGRHVGPYGSVAATGKVVTMTGVDIFRLADGKIVACRSLWDGLSVYEQMGVLSYPE